MASKPMTDADRSPLLKAFGNAGRVYRKAQGFSQEGVAHYCGLDSSSYGSRGIATAGVGGNSPQTGFEYERLPTFLTLFAGQCQVQSK